MVYIATKSLPMRAGAVMRACIVVAIGIATIEIIDSSVLSSEGSVCAVKHSVIVSLTIPLHIWIWARWWCTGAIMRASVVVAICVTAIVIVHPSVLRSEGSVCAVKRGVIVSLTIPLCVAWWRICDARQVYVCGHICGICGRVCLWRVNNKECTSGKE